MLNSSSIFWIACMMPAVRLISRWGSTTAMARVTSVTMTTARTDDTTIAIG